MVMMQKALATVVVMATAAAMLTARAPAPGESQAAPADVSAPPPDAVKTASGLVSRTITPGTSAEKPTPTDVITVHYTGWTADGETIDSSRSRSTPPMFPLNRSLLLDTRRAPPVPPPDVAEPPADARRAPSGLAYKVLTPGTGTRRPFASDRVTVHYTGWTTDGKMFDSSVARGMPQTLALSDVIRGWTEGMQLMLEGERTRFWIPQDLAYKGEVGSPRGMLVFDIDLIRIE